MSINHSKKYQPVDIFETIPLFKAIDNKKDRDDLKKVLIPENYQEGDILFKYSTFASLS